MAVKSKGTYKGEIAGIIELNTWRVCFIEEGHGKYLSIGIQRSDTLALGTQNSLGIQTAKSGTKKKMMIMRVRKEKRGRSGEGVKRGIWKEEGRKREYRIPVMDLAIGCFGIPDAHSVVER